MDYKIREAAIGDIDNINKPFNQMLQSIYICDTAEGYPQNYLKENYFENEQNVIYVAETEHFLIGFLSIEYHDDANGSYLYLDDFFVSQEWRCHGIGTQLLDLADKYAKKSGAQNIFLHVEKSNSIAISLYNKLGYAQHRSEGDRIMMVKKVGF